MIKSLFALFAILLFMTESSANISSREREAIPPNIIYINIDDLGFMDMGYSGSSYYSTPNIDKLAQEGIVFSQGYAGAANCAPSRACFISGMNTPRHGIYTVKSSERGKSSDRKIIPIENTEDLRENIVTIAERLQESGYTTATVGKWHLTNDPTTQGFDINIAGNHAGHPKTYFSPYKNPNLSDGKDGEYLTDRLTNEAISIIERETSKESPLFLYLPYFTVHTPIQGKEELIEIYKKKRGSGGQDNPVYGAMVEAMDTNIGKIMEAIDRAGISNNTLIVFTSDNGGINAISSQAPLRAGKGSYYEGGIRVPFIVKWASSPLLKTTNNTPITNMDFYPTFLEFAGIKSSLDQPMDGVSLYNLITKGKSLKSRYLYWHFPIYLQAYSQAEDDGRDPKFRTRPGAVVRYREWKLHQYFEDGALELYNLNSDPGERDNIAEKYPKVTKRLLLKMEEWRVDIKAPVPNKQNPNYINNK